MTDFTERGLPERVARNREVARLRDGEKLAWDAIAERLSIGVRTATRGYSEQSSERGAGDPGDVRRRGRRGSSDAPRPGPGSGGGRNLWASHMRA